MEPAKKGIRDENLKVRFGWYAIKLLYDLFHICVVTVKWLLDKLGAIVRFIGGKGERI